MAMMEALIVQSGVVQKSPITAQTVAASERRERKHSCAEPQS
jgi:hypothetical protein